MSDELAYIMSCEDKAGALRLLIADAVDVERERCAKIAEKHGDTWSNSRDMSVCVQEAAVDAKVVEIAAAIRSDAQ